MDRRLPYRRGSPLLKPLPLVNMAITDTGLIGDHNEDDMNNKIVEILREHDIHFRFVSLINRAQASEFGTTSLIPTYYVLVHMESSAVDTWDPAVQAIRDFLDECNLQHIVVEFMDVQRAATTSVAIMPDLFTDAAASQNLRFEVDNYDSDSSRY
jgi:hypothetical protein